MPWKRGGVCGASRQGPATRPALHLGGRGWRGLHPELTRSGRSHRSACLLVPGHLRVLQEASWTPVCPRGLGRRTLRPGDQTQPATPQGSVTARHLSHTVRESLSTLHRMSSTHLGGSNLAPSHPSARSYSPGLSRKLARLPPIAVSGVGTHPSLPERKGTCRRNCRGHGLGKTDSPICSPWAVSPWTCHLTSQNQSPALGLFSSFIAGPFGLPQPLRHFLSV